MSSIAASENRAQNFVNNILVSSNGEHILGSEGAIYEVEQNEDITDEDQYEEDDEFYDEPHLDDDDDEALMQNSATNDTNSVPDTTTSAHPDYDLHPLLLDDINDIFTQVPPEELAGASYQIDTENPRLLRIIFQFFTDFIEGETACQWQICNKTLLTCHILVHSKCYLEEKVIVEHVFQTCSCHPAYACKVPFIERLVRDFFEKAAITMEKLTYSRAALNSKLRLNLEIIPKIKQESYRELLGDAVDETLLNDSVANEILDNEKRIARKLELIKAPRIQPLDVDQHYDLLDEKHLPSLYHGHFVQFCKYIIYRLKNLNTLCVMCGKRTIDRDTKKALKPMICSDYECFSNAMDSKFRNDPLPPSIFSIEIADFLLLLVSAAIRSGRHALILDPYPKLINPYNTSTTLIDEHGDKDANVVILRQIVDDIMRMKSITQYEAVKISLRSMLELKHPWAFSFFHWLMGTNRYHFSRIPTEHQLTQVHTEHQYFIKHEDLTKHVNFKNLRAQVGSIFAFHGSPQENWHSILRSGLQIGKGGYLLNGAAYGAGIYVSPSFEFSASYVWSRAMYRSNPNTSTYDPEEKIQPLDQQNWSCIALCEIINSPEVYKKHSTDIWTIQDPNLICTRFIFFYPSGLHSLHFRVDSEEIATSIRKLIHTLNNTAC
ncbi:unnamed protein product [Adineta ricciae]|uniref:PARP catalytic domain-containing protein n=1 Tax=Adineta ricciae TaxID=249248 RepID=A0A815MMV5_ADIRI|nr:unnamed protein product [Adineta ricciae]